MLDTAAMSPDTRIAHVAELKEEKAGGDVSVFMERRRNPTGNLDLSGNDDDDERIDVDADRDRSAHCKHTRRHNKIKRPLPGSLKKIVARPT